MLRGKLAGDLEALAGQDLMTLFNSSTVGEHIPADYSAIPCMMVHASGRRKPHDCCYLLISFFFVQADAPS